MKKELELPTTFQSTEEQECTLMFKVWAAVLVERICKGEESMEVALEKAGAIAKATIGPVKTGTVFGFYFLKHRLATENLFYPVTLHIGGRKIEAKIYWQLGDKYPTVA